MKPSKRNGTMGLFIVYQILYWKLGETFGMSSFHLKNSEGVLGLKCGMRMGSIVLNLGLVNARLVWPIHILVGQAKRLVFNSPTPHTLCMVIWALENLGSFSLTQGVGVNPWFHVLYFTNNSIDRRLYNCTTLPFRALISNWIPGLLLLRCESRH